MEPVIPILNLIDTFLNVVEKTLPGSEERLKRMALREEAIKARAKTQAEREAKKQFEINISKLTKAIRVARRHKIDTTGIEADLKQLLESIQ